MFNKNNQSGDNSEQNPFFRKSKILRSPTPRNTLTKNEIIASQVKENVVSESATNEKISNLEKLCGNLIKQIDDLILENQRLKSLINTNSTDMPVETDSTKKGAFHTDEEELTRETESIKKA